MLTPHKPLPDGLEYPGQIPASQVKHHAFVDNPDAIRLPDATPVREERTAYRGRYELLLPSAKKTPCRSLAPAKDEIVCSTHELQPVLLLTAGTLPVALLTSGEPIAAPVPDMQEMLDAMERANLERRIKWVDYTEVCPKFPVAPTQPEPAAESVSELNAQTEVEIVISNDTLEPEPAKPEPFANTEQLEASALSAIAAMQGYPVVKFLRVFGVPTMDSLLNQGLIREEKDKLFIKEQPQPVTPAPAQDELLSSTKQLSDSTLQLEVEPAPVEAQVVEPPTPVIPARRTIDPLANALTTQKMQLNMSNAFRLANKITDNSNAAHLWLRNQFHIGSGSLLTTEVLAKVEAAVNAELQKYLARVTLDELLAWVMAVYGVGQNNQSVIQCLKYSNRRTGLLTHLYQKEAEAWLRDLRKAAKPEQVILAGEYMEAKRRSGQSGRRVH